ncbi:hypothetical protein LINPERPRIM_LOCUS41138, partial [Linum perenne]
LNLEFIEDLASENVFLVESGPAVSATATYKVYIFQSEEIESIEVSRRESKLWPQASLLELDDPLVGHLTPLRY